MIDIRRLDSTLRYDEYDYIYLIVRSSKLNNPHIVHLPELAPSHELFFMYRKWVEEDQWNEETFDEKYVPTFLKDLVNNPNAVNTLNKIYQMDKDGKRICLLCFCGNERICHRSIIAGLLQGSGAHVKLQSKKDYSSYYKDYEYYKRTLSSRSMPVHSYDPGKLTYVVKGLNSNS